MTIKGSSPHMRHASRTYRVDLGCLFENVNLELDISMKYVHTNQQIAHMSTKSSLTCDEWNGMN